MTIEADPRWQKGADGLFHPTPPYVEGTIEKCEGCGRPMRVSAYAALHQWLYSECEPCGRDYDAWLMRDQ